jgi:hypothetical protein
MKKIESVEGRDETWRWKMTPTTILGAPYIRVALQYKRFGLWWTKGRSFAEDAALVETWTKHYVLHLPEYDEADRRRRAERTRNSYFEEKRTRNSYFEEK